jgi:hypothetical protein
MRSGEAVVYPPDQALVPVDAVLVLGSHIRVENVWCHQLVGGLRVVLVPGLFVQPVDYGLVLFRQKLLLSATPGGSLLN